MKNTAASCGVLLSEKVFLGLYTKPRFVIHHQFKKRGILTFSA